MSVWQTGLLVAAILYLRFQSLIWPICVDQGSELGASEVSSPVAGIAGHPNESLDPSRHQLISFVYFFSGVCETCLCVIESALLRSSMRINLYALDAEKMSEELKGVGISASDLSRISIIPIDLESIFKDTPLEGFQKSKEYLACDMPNYAISNSVRLAIIYKTGGIYSDLDLLQISKGIDDFPLNFVQMQDRFTVNGEEISDDATNKTVVGFDSHMITNSLFGFSQNSPFVWEIMQTFRKKFVIKVKRFWGSNGPLNFTRISKKCFYKTNLGSGLTKEECSKIQIIPWRTGYPVHWAENEAGITHVPLNSAEGRKLKNLLKKWQSVILEIKMPKMKHTTSIDGSHQTQISADSLLASYMKASCPRTYENLIKPTIIY